MKNKALVLDLDGTLYSINTFHYFIRYILWQSLIRFKLILFINISTPLLLRILRVISHSKMKYIVLRTIRDRTDIDYNDFTSNIKKFRRKLNFGDHRQFDLKILATAAPDCYSSIIAKENDIGICCATNFPQRDHSKNFENIREVKKANVMKILNSYKVDQIDTLVTDHIDDLPLMKVSKHVIIINPTSDLEKELSNQGIAFVTQFH